MKHTFTTLWNSLVLVAVAFTIWSGYQFWHSVAEPKSVDRVDVSAKIIEVVRHVNKQIFVEHYSSAEIRNVDAPEGWLAWLGDVGVRQEFLMLVRGRVPAGIDLSQLGADDIWVSADGRRAQVTLPAPQIFTENISVDMAHTEIIQSSDYCPGFICPNDRLEAFKEHVEPEARKQLIAAAEEKGILTQTALDAAVYYEQLLNALGIAEVRVIVPGYTSGQELP